MLHCDWLLSLAELEVNIPPFVVVSCGGITIVGYSAAPVGIASILDCGGSDECNMSLELSACSGLREKNFFVV